MLLTISIEVSMEHWDPTRKTMLTEVTYDRLVESVSWLGEVQDIEVTDIPRFAEVTEEGNV